MDTRLSDQSIEQLSGHCEPADKVNKTTTTLICQLERPMRELSVMVQLLKKTLQSLELRLQKPVRESPVLAAIQELSGKVGQLSPLLRDL